MVAHVCSVSGCLYYRLYRPSRKAYGAHIVAWIARPQSILGELADETCWTMRELREGKHGVLVGMMGWGVMGCGCGPRRASRQESQQLATLRARSALKAG